MVHLIKKIIKEIQKLGQQKQLKLDKRSQLEDELNVIQSQLKWYYFFNWYIDNLLICENLIVYAAMVFGNVEGVKAPKNINSSNYSKVLNGIENQAWDIHHLSQ